MYGKEIKKVLITRDEIAKRVKELGEQINRDYKGEAITLVCTLRGASIFFADLVRELEGDVEMDFYLGFELRRRHEFERRSEDDKGLVRAYKRQKRHCR